MDVAFRPMQRATMRVVADAGFRAVRTTPAGCCGALAMHYGQPEAAKAMARARIAEMEDAELVVVNASGCSAHVKTYGELLAGDPVWAERAERVAERTRDLIELSPAAARRGHRDGGGARRVPPPPRPGPRSRAALLRDAGATCVELGDGGRCCGAAGLYSVPPARARGAAAAPEGGGRSPPPARPWWRSPTRAAPSRSRAGLREIGARVRVAHPAELISPERRV